MTTLSTRQKGKSYLFNVLKENRLFILFSFLSCVLPIIYCLLSSLIKPDGSQAVMALGHVMPFLLAFMQIAFTISMIIFAKLSDLKNMRTQDDNTSIIISATIWMSLFIGFVSSVFYIGSSVAYMYFSNNRPNTQSMLNYGLDFIWVTTPYVILFPLFVTSLFIVRRKNTRAALRLTFCHFLFAAAFSFTFAFAFELKVLGLGLGLTTALLLSLGLNYLYIKFFYPIILYTPMSVREFNLLISKVVLKESMTSISLSVFKGLAIICLSFTIPNTINGFVPLSYQMSRVIWFNMMYFIPFIGIGVGEGIRYHYLYKHSKYSVHDCYLNHRWRNDFKLLFLTLGLTIIIALGCIFLVVPLNKIYSINDHNIFSGDKLPELVINNEVWGRPTIEGMPNTIFDFNKLAELKLTPLPNFLPTNTNNQIQNAINYAKNLKMLQEWLQVNAQNNQAVLGDLYVSFQELGKWYQWLQQTNDKGESIIQFIERVYQLQGGFLQEIKNAIVSGKPSPNLLMAIQGGLGYFVYLWLYSSTTSVVTDSFLLLRPIIGYKDVLTLSQDVIISSGQTPSQGAIVFYALTHYSINDVFTSLFLKINTFEAKAMIYVSVYGVLNSIWSILIQLNQRNERKGMPYWLLTIVYAICVGSLVTFGTLFAVTFKDKLGANNPFNYLDAWTFPLIVISFFVIVILSVKCYIGYKKVKYERRISSVEVY